MNILNIKKEFPIFNNKVHNNDLVYLDSANSSQKPQSVINRINDPVDSEITEKLSNNFNDFNRAFNENGMTIEEFEFFGASKHTMDTFLDGYDEFIQIIRSRMINR